MSEVLGTEHGQVKGVALRDTVTGETREMEADGLFVAIGHDPTTALFYGILDMDEAGYLVTRERLDRDQCRRACSPPATSSTTSTARP